MTAPARGCKGHLGAAAHGRVTTGLVKIVGIGATGLVAAALADRGRDDVGALDTLVGGAVVAGAANLANLLDLRPGRALKVTVLACRCRCSWPRGSRPAPRAAAAAGAALGVLRPDLAGTAMLGDTGANAAGALVGTALLGAHRPCAAGWPRSSCSPALTLASEKVSLHPGHRVDAGAARARRLGPARTMTGRRFASGIAGAAGLIAGHDPARPDRRLRPDPGLHRRRCAPVASAGIYQSVNAIPNVMFEVAAGGILAAVAVPLIAQRLGAGERDRADHTASVLLSWTLAGARAAVGPALAARGADLVVLSSSRATRGPPRWRPRCCGSSRCRCRSTAWASSSPGCSRPTGASSRRRWRRWPPRSSCWRPTSGTARSSTAQVAPSLRQRRGDPGARLGHHARCRGAVGAAGRAGDAHRLAVAARRCGCRPRTPAGSARSAAAGILALRRPAGRRAWSRLRLSKRIRRPRHVHRLPLRAGRLPAALRRAGRAGRHERLPGARRAHVARARTSSATLAAHAARRARADRAVGRASSSPRRRPSAPSSRCSTPAAATRATSTAALAALPGALTAYAPGLVGFGLTALLTRALYVRGRPTDAGIAAALGLGLAALLPLRRAGGRAGPGEHAALARASARRSA